MERLSLPNRAPNFWLCKIESDPTVGFELQFEIRWRSIVEVIIAILFFLVPLVICGLVIGRTVEKRHLKNLEERESATSGMLVTQIKSFPNASNSGPPPNLVLAEVAIGSDHLKSFLAKWRNIFGGEVRSFQTLQERGKREVILRLVEKARDQGYNAVCNVRVSPADVGGNIMTTKKKQMPMAVVIASGTAYNANP